MTLKPGDKVVNIVQEMDIELIPAMTEITLTRCNHPYWYGEAVIHGKDRTVLVLNSNLKKIEETL